MRKFFLSVAAILALVGGADAQSLSDRLAGSKPKPKVEVEVKPEPKVEHRLPSPWGQPAKKAVPTDLSQLYVPPPPMFPLPADFGKGSLVLKGLDTGKFGLNPAPLPIMPQRARDYSGVKPTTLWEPSLDLGKPFEFVRPMDVTKLPLDRATVLGWKKDFPLLGDDFEVQGSGTPNPTTCATKAGTDKAIPGTYNCIAHTAGIKNVWVNPYQKGEGWDLYYHPLGYKRVTGTDTGFVKGTQKVAVYAKKLPDGRLKEYTHAAVQEADGTWTSKLGSGPLIRHRTAEAVGGGSYGEVVRVYERTR